MRRNKPRRGDWVDIEGMKFRIIDVFERDVLDVQGRPGITLQELRLRRQRRLKRENVIMAVIGIIILLIILTLLTTQMLN